MAGWSIYADIYDPSMSCEKLQHTKEVRCLYSQQPLPILHGQNRHESWVVPLGHSLCLPPLLKAVTCGKQELPPGTPYLPGMGLEATPPCAVVQGPPCR